MRLVLSATIWLICSTVLFAQEPKSIDLPPLASDEFRYTLLKPDNMSDVDAATYPETAKHYQRWRVIVLGTRWQTKSYFFLDCTSETLAGPWTPSNRKLRSAWAGLDGPDYRFTPDGKFLLIPRSGDGDRRNIDKVVLVDPTTLQSQAVTVPRVKNKVGHYVSANGEQIALVSGGKGVPLQVAFFHIPSKRIRSTIKLKERVGDISEDRQDLAAHSFALSRDFRLLALAEGWEGVRRKGKFGIEIFDARTGAILQRFTHGDQANVPFATKDAGRHTKDPSFPKESHEVGCTAISFSLDGTVLSYQLVRRKIWGPRSEWQDGPTFAPRMHVALKGSEVLQTAPDLELRETFATTVDGQLAAVEKTEWKPERHSLKILNADKSLVRNWHRIPSRVATLMGASSNDSRRQGSGCELVSGTNGMVGVESEYGREGRDIAIWYDWKTEELREFRVTPVKGITCFSAQHAKAILLIDGAVGNVPLGETGHEKLRPKVEIYSMPPASAVK